MVSLPLARYLVALKEKSVKFGDNIQCPLCGSKDCFVTCTRPGEDTITRHHKCRSCLNTFKSIGIKPLLDQKKTEEANISKSKKKKHRK